MYYYDLFKRTHRNLSPLTTKKCITYNLLSPLDHWFDKKFTDFFQAITENELL